MTIQLPVATLITLVLISGGAAAQSAGGADQGRAERAAVAPAEQSAERLGGDTASPGPPDGNDPSAVATTGSASPLAATVAPRRSRPSLLIPMYASLGTIQMLDYHSTTRALASGAGREANPVAGVLLKNDAAFLVAKAAVTAALVVTAEKLWKKHPRRAVVFIAAANGAMGAIVARNYSIRPRN